MDGNVVHILCCNHAIRNLLSSSVVSHILVMQLLMVSSLLIAFKLE
uniref:Uncharacterized protein n=1 Tax=Rhizophora mucronata TaxID=61149 RepID=A0A2P2P0A4_RHIMU